MIKCMGGVNDAVDQIDFRLNQYSTKFIQPRGWGGRCRQGNPWYSQPASMKSRLASITSKMASKVFIEETDKNFDLITEILFRYFGFGDFKVAIVIEN